MKLRRLSERSSAMVVAPWIHRRRAAPQSPLAASEAAAFIGNWTINLEACRAPSEQTLVLKDANGKAGRDQQSAATRAPGSRTSAKPARTGS